MSVKDLLCFCACNSAFNPESGCDCLCHEHDLADANGEEIKFTNGEENALMYVICKMNGIEPPEGLNFGWYDTMFAAEKVQRVQEKHKSNADAAKELLEVIEKLLEIEYDEIGRL